MNTINGLLFLNIQLLEHSLPVFKSWLKGFINVQDVTVNAYSLNRSIDFVFKYTVDYLMSTA